MENDTAPARSDDLALDAPPRLRRSRRSRLRLALLATLGVALLVSAVAVVELRPEEEDVRRLPPVPGDYPFGDRSVWRQDVSRAPLNPQSAALVANVDRQVRDNWGGTAAFNVDNFTTSFFTAAADQPTVDVSFDDCQKKGYTPEGLEGPAGQFAGVPIPDEAVPAKGTDAQLTVYQPSTDRLWEFWQARQVDGRWQACWGGRIDDASTSPGFFSGGFGSAATGLAVSGGTIRVDDVRSGSIEHAIGLQVISPRTPDVISWPAQRSDGWSKDPTAVPEGLRLRLDPAVDVDSLHLTPIATMIAKAAQRYGFIVTDKSGSVSVAAETGSATAGSDPWPSMMRGVPHYSILTGFPWDRLQALPVDYGKP